MAVKEVKLSTIEEALTTPTTAEFNDALKRNRSAFLFRASDGIVKGRLVNWNPAFCATSQNMQNQHRP